MAMNATTVASAVCSSLEAELGFTFSPEQRTKAEQTWKAVFSAFIAHMATNGTITIQANDLQVPGNSGLTEVNNAGTTVSVGGTGKVSATTLTGRIS